MKVLQITLFILVISLGLNGAEYRITNEIYMEISINGMKPDRMVFGLFGEIAPRTVRNFRELTLHGINGINYVGTNFLVAIKRVMILGGDIVFNNGSGSISIYGKHFNDEPFTIKHDSAGLLSMANFGVPNTNGCMFLIITMPTPWLDGKNVVFGKVLKGHGVLHKIEHLKTDYRDRLMDDVRVVEVGEISIKPYYENHKNYELTIWAWIKAGWFPLGFSLATLGFFHYVILQLNKLQSFQ